MKNFFDASGFDFLLDFGNKLFDQASTLTDVNVDTFKKFGDEQIKLAEKVSDYALRQVELSSDVNDVQSYVIKQAQAGKELRDQLVASAEETAGVWKQAGSRYAEAVRGLAKSGAEASA